MKIWTCWLIIAGFFLVLELASPTFLFFWVAIGALIAMIASFFIPEMIIAQICIWAITSIALIVLAGKILKKTDKESPAMNVYSIIGKRALVTEEINDLKNQGQVKIGGDVWSARTENENEVIPKDTTVEITKIDGVKVIVKKVEITENVVSQNN